MVVAMGIEAVAIGTAAVTMCIAAVAMGTAVAMGISTVVAGTGRERTVSTMGCVAVPTVVMVPRLIDLVSKSAGKGTERMDWTVASNSPQSSLSKEPVTTCTRSIS